MKLLGSELGLWKPQDDFPNQFSSENALAFLDNHNSRYNERLYFGDTKEERLEYKLGIAFMLASDFGVKRIFSTFFSKWRLPIQIIQTGTSQIQVFLFFAAQRPTSMTLVTL